MMEPEQIQPMSVRELFKNAMRKGTEIFSLSLIGNFVIIALFSTIVFILYDYLESIEVNNTQLNTLGIINNMLFISLTSVNVFYLLVNKEDQSFMEKVKSSLLKTLKMMPTLLATTIVFSIFVTLGFTLLLIPGLILFTYLGIYAQTIAFENQGIIASLLRSRDLVKGSFWKVFGVLVSLFILTTLTILIIAILIGTIIPANYLWLEVLIYCISYSLMMPFIGSIYTLLYFDLRARQEAFDYNTFENEQKKIATF